MKRFYSHCLEHYSCQFRLISFLWCHYLLNIHNLNIITIITGLVEKNFSFIRILVYHTYWRLKNGSDIYCDVTPKPKQKIFYCLSITFWWDTLYNTFKIKIYVNHSCEQIKDARYATYFFYRCVSSIKIVYIISV